MKIWSIDFDGIIHNEGEPLYENIDKINLLSKDYNNFIVIHTSRPWNKVDRLVEFLHKWNVKFDAVSMEKMKADVYVDDKNDNNWRFGKWKGKKQGEDPKILL